jgi:hypothetical protein
MYGNLNREKANRPPDLLPPADNVHRCRSARKAGERELMLISRPEAAP